MSSRIVICTNGTLGDFYPYLAIALELKARGHSVVLATGRLYQTEVETQGIEFYPIQPDLSSYTPEALRAAISKMMDCKRGTEYVLRQLLIPHVKTSYDAMMDIVRGADLLLTHPLFFAGPLVAEKTGIRWVSTVLAPISIPSIYDPAVLNADSLIQPKMVKPWLARLLQQLGRWYLRPWSEPIRQLRNELGLSIGGDPLFEGQFSPHLVLALFSQVLAIPQPDWPSQVRIAGFMFDDRDRTNRLPPELIDFLDAGSPPIVFTLGSSAVWDADDFFIESALAARRSGYRAVLLAGPDVDRLPSECLSENIVAFGYVPHSALFPRAAAIVLHGGIGTTAQALRSGRPMLFVPYAHDQPDNAARAKRLGVARILSRRRYKANRLAIELRSLLEDSSYTNRAAEISLRVRAETGVRAACDAIEAQLKVPPRVVT
ncbi:glycosyltransferase [Pseudanabaena sp. PCC 6802]|uniref:glycosyltransferase n=1 Tax=Pseudanabaena sp. PCC 6802 TaxID=118173 RepID=UPI000345C629|nr:glycosyltransferase [Pseudanabaena sp. PCC 6802]